MATLSCVHCHSHNGFTFRASKDVREDIRFCAQCMEPVCDDCWRKYHVLPHKTALIGKSLLEPQPGY